jgi:hypothetical protein
MNTIVRNLATKSGYAVEAPNYKHQITNKFQRSKFQTIGKRFGHLKLKFGIYLGFVIWYLEFQSRLGGIRAMPS